MNPTIIVKDSGSVECRICSLNFVPDSEEDRKIHALEHQRLLCGGLPLRVREVLKSVGWAVVHNDGGFDRLKEQWTAEIGKRAVIFSWWTRAVSNGVPKDEFERFMEAHFAFVDAEVSGDETLIAARSEAIKPWERYAG